MQRMGNAKCMADCDCILPFGKDGVQTHRNEFCCWIMYAKMQITLRQIDGHGQIGWLIVNRGSVTCALAWFFGITTLKNASSTLNSFKYINAVFKILIKKKQLEINLNDLFY